MTILDLMTSLWAISPEYFHFGVDIFERRYLKQERLSDTEIKEITKNTPRGKYQIIDGVAIIPICGVIAPKLNLIDALSVGGVSPQTIKEQFKDALSDKDVHTILLDMNTPGGTVAYNFDLADYIYESRGIKPIIALVSDKATSAGQLLAAAADEIVLLEQSTAMGSIGVVTTHIETWKAQENEGYKVYEIAIPKNKRIVSEYEPMTEEGRAHIENQLSQLYDIFVARMQKFRGMTDKEVRETDGLVFRGRKAIEMNLADRILSREKLIDELVQNSKPRIGGFSMAEKEVAISMTELEAMHQELEMLRAKEKELEKLKAEVAEDMENVYQETEEEFLDALDDLVEAKKLSPAEKAILVEAFSVTEDAQILLDGDKVLAMLENRPESKLFSNIELGELEEKDEEAEVKIRDGETLEDYKKRQKAAKA